ncbi:glycosyltransferase [Chryseobacterium sp. cx-624]|uniref:Glycosyltransferase n=1 Tax=Marnyiella aurantia TaxID=2758037 RepID=A0A838ZLM1_9FLAO|nr:glycosyltransferase [Marnyiella aurantia]
MKILIIADEVWNDRIHGNNVLTNWFTGFDAEFAEVYCSPGAPSNPVCTRYFQVTDAMMAKSLMGKRAGHAFETEILEMQASEVAPAAEPIPEKFYSTMKSLAGEPLRAVRDMIWLTGRYNQEALKKIIDDFQPDVVFCPRLLSPKLMRLEKIISKMTTAPFVAFTADDEASMMQVSYSPLYWIKRLLFRSAFKNHVKLYKHYFTFSAEQACDYNAQYDISTSTLYKSGDFSHNFVKKEVNDPIKLVYAGRLYCNRWKTLAAVADALKVINVDGIRMTLDIYTQEKVTDEHRKEILTSEAVKIHDRVSPQELTEIYREADVALHVESFEKKYRYATRVSFSTKIIDLMSSTCAILAICWDRHAGFQYLQEHDAAFCVDEVTKIEPQLLQLAMQPELITEYARKAWNCGKQNHQRELIQDELMNVFKRIMQQHKGGALISDNSDSAKL